MKKRLTAEEVAPHGWVLVGSTAHCCPSERAIAVDDHWYVPAKPEPRTWTGTVGQFFNCGRPRWLGSSARIIVTEVLD